MSEQNKIEQAIELFIKGKAIAGEDGEMITIYWYCHETPNDEKFVADSLKELAQNLRKEPIKLDIGVERLAGDRKLTEKTDAILKKFSNQSYRICDCDADITDVFHQFRLIDTTRMSRLLVYCRPDSGIAKAAKRQAPWALWGGTSGCLAAVYKHNNKFTIWHEAVHLLLSRSDERDECYEPYPPYAKKCDCDCEPCLMQYAPSEETIGEWPSLCTKVIELLQGLAKKWK
jgi:hypothetical protein